MHKFNRIRQMAPTCPRGRTRCRHLQNTIEPSAYGGDRAHVKLLWLIVIFGHAHLDSRTDSRALRAEYYIVGILRNTPNKFFFQNTVQYDAVISHLQPLAI